MKSFMLSTALVATLATPAFAQDTADESALAYAQSMMTGSIEVEIAENAAGDYAAATTFGIGIASPGLTFGQISLESTTGDSFEVNEWYIGTAVGEAASVSFGDHDGGIFVESYSDYSDIVEPTIGVALIGNVGNAAVAVGFTDVKTDITDVSNVQAAYTLNTPITGITASMDYNLDSEDYALAGRIHGIDVAGAVIGSTISYENASEMIAYEADATVYGVTAYVNGDKDDALKNVGAGYVTGYGSLEFATDVNYNIDTEEFSPSATVTFSF